MCVCVCVCECVCETRAYKNPATTFEKINRKTMDPRWEHPFTCVIAGPTGCGKTYFVKQFLQHLSDMMNPIPSEVIWYYG